MVDINLPDPNDLLSGGSIPSLSFKDVKVGTSYTGTITDLQTVQVKDFATGEPKYWEDGKPQLQIQVTLATDLRDPSIDDDNGDRRVYLFGQKLTAAREALKASGLQKFELGSKFTITFSGTKPAKTKGFNDVKLYSIAIEKGSSNPAVDALLASGAKEVSAEGDKLDAEQVKKAQKMEAAGFDTAEIAGALGVNKYAVEQALSTF
jgi:copper chaperone CopZ